MEAIKTTNKANVMRKKSSSTVVEWLKSAQGKSTLEASMAKTNERTVAISKSMRVNQESLLKPVTL